MQLEESYPLVSVCPPSAQYCFYIVLSGHSLSVSDRKDVSCVVARRVVKHRPQGLII